VIAKRLPDFFYSVPMKFQRYIGGMGLLSAFSAIGLFVFILITGNALRDLFGLLADGRIQGHLFFDLLWLLVPYAVSFAMPLGMLIAVLIVMGRLSANREITALRAAGVSLWSVALPILLVALAGSALAAYINAYHAPAARASYRSILHDLVRTDPLRFIIPQTFIHEFPGYVIWAGERDRKSLKNFWLWELDENQRAVRLLRAEEGTFTFDEANDSLLLTLQEGFTELRDPDKPNDLQSIHPTLSFRDARIRLPLENILGEANRPMKISYMRLAELYGEQQRLSRAVAAATGGETEEKLRAEKMKYQYYLSRNLAMAMSVVSLAFLGIPLGLQASRSETYANTALAIIIGMVYYTGIITIDWFDDQVGLRPDLLVWIPNLLCQGAGTWLIFRYNRQS